MAGDASDEMERAVEKLAAVLKEQDMNGTLDQSADTQELISKISAASELNVMFSADCLRPPFLAQ